MMNNNALFLCSCLILISCLGQTNESIRGDQTPENNRITILFNFELKQGSLLTCQEEEILFAALPKDYKEYRNFFCKRFKLNDGRKLHLTRTLSLFQNLYCIKDERLIEVLFSWSKNADIEERCETFLRGSSGGYFDAVINLQELNHSFFSTRIEEAIKVLKTKPEDEIKSFWHFYFDGPHPESHKEDFEVLNDRYAAKNERIAKLMTEAYDKLLSESDGHGH